MANKNANDTNVAILVIAIIGVFSLAALIQFTKPSAQGLAIAGSGLDIANPTIVPLPTDCRYIRSNSMTNLQCDCQERVGTSRASNPITANLPGKYCDNAHVLCKELCKRPSSIGQGYLVVPNLGVSIAVAGFEEN